MISVYAGPPFLHTMEVHSTNIPRCSVRMELFYRLLISRITGIRGRIFSMLLNGARSTRTDRNERIPSTPLEWRADQLPADPGRGPCFPEEPTPPVMAMDAPFCSIPLACSYCVVLGEVTRMKTLFRSLLFLIVAGRSSRKPLLLNSQAGRIFYSAGSMRLGIVYGRGGSVVRRMTLADN